MYTKSTDDTLTQLNRMEDMERGGDASSSAVPTALTCVPLLVTAMSLPGAVSTV